ncbi:glutathione S-transferas-like protein [Massarina eburnea CBS 473.64]|uniref:Glutathione S-transferas-like protein n=1 Tax=Massarina eburnea CBS 473.64 TaxID=1395130 RepID=A0A6A6S1W3_9PLEO|nr:glutathione S-transferas-like protein [Massarina eburnea CBS 473.64]
MVLTIHHMGISQSERIIWLCEELGIEYKLIKHVRDPVLAPTSLKINGNDTGKAPFIEDPESGITLAESGAIVEYILARNATGELGGYLGEKKLAKKYGEKGYVDYIYWFHYANAGLQPAMMGSMFLDLVSLDNDDRTKTWADQRLHATLKHVDDRLAEAKWLAGDDFTAADIMVVYSLTTQRYFGPKVSYKGYANIVRFLGDVKERPAYGRAMEKGDPEMRLLLGEEPPVKTLVEAGGVGSDVWKK